MKRTSQTNRVLPGTVGAIFALGLAACGEGNRAGIEPDQSVRAKKNISDSFVVRAENAGADGNKGSLAGHGRVEAVDAGRVTIKREALEKEFLLQANLIFAPVVPTGSGMQSNVVKFRLRDGKLYMLLANQGHQVTADLPQHLVLADMPIVAEDSETLTFDFNEGMKALFLMGDWYASDFYGPSYMPPYISVKVNYSYVESSKINSKNELEIRQVAMLDLPAFGIDFGFPVETRYYLSAYDPDPSFEPVKSKGFDKVGYFEANPLLDSQGNSVVNATKWNTKKKITWAVSANTPENMKQAVKDGVLYWNTVFGEEKVEVIDAPVGVTAPDVDYNVVQWVPWDTAGFAYADAQMDPRSGEILHAQVYMTSVFAYIGKIRARMLSKRIGAKVVESEEKARELAKEEMIREIRAGQRLPEIAVKGFEKAKLCNIDYREALASAIENLDVKLLSDENLTRVAQDYVREVVAHEIGHTLGLRHNFAGSLATNYPLTRRNDIVRGYLADGTVPTGIVATSSVMEYQAFEEASITGAQIASKKVVLEYDRKAIGMLYKGEKYSMSEMPVFCTDTRHGVTQDCRVWDIGRSPMEYATWKVKQDLSMLPYMFVEAHQYAKAPVWGEDPYPVEETYVNSAGAAAGVMGIRSRAWGSLVSGTSTWKVQRNFPVVSELNETEYQAAELANALTELEQSGGIANVLAATPEGYGETAAAKVAELVDGAYSGGVTVDGMEYSFTPAEAEYVKKAAVKYFANVEKALVKAELDALLGRTTVSFWGFTFVTTMPGQITDDERGKQLSAWLQTRQDQLMYAVTGEATPEEIQYATPGVQPPVLNTTTVKLAKFRYDVATRMSAAGLIAMGRSADLDWMVAERLAAGNKWKGFFKDALGGHEAYEIDVLTVPKHVRKWITENQMILVY